MHASALFELLTALRSCGWGTAYAFLSALVSSLLSLDSALWLHNPLLWFRDVYGIRHPTVSPRWG